MRENPFFVKEMLVKNNVFEKVVATVIVITGIVTIEKKLEEVAFKGLDRLFKDKKEPNPKPAE